jgi:hypothetical protein
MNDVHQQPSSFSLRTFCETAACSRQHAYDLIREGFLEATISGPKGAYYISREAWNDYWARLRADRQALNRIGLRFPVTKAGEKPKTRAELAFGGAVRVAEREKIKNEVFLQAYDALRKQGLPEKKARELLAGVLATMDAHDAALHSAGGRPS